MAHELDLTVRLQLGDRSITIGGHASPYRLLSSGFSGGEGAEAVIETAAHAACGGDAVLSRRIAGRDMTLVFEIADHDNREAYRAALLSFFDPTADGVLTVMRSVDGKTVTRAAACMLSGRVTLTQESLHAFIRVRVPLFCPEPYFQSEAVNRDAAKTVTPLLSFPLTVTGDCGLTSGLIRCADTVSVRNTGDAPTGFVLQMTAMDAGGTAGMVNPAITREEDGAYIRLLTSLEKGDTLTVSTVPGAKYVLKNGEPCLLFDRGSTFFALNRGVNTLKITADAMLEPPDVRISFRNRYFGA